MDNKQSELFYYKLREFLKTELKEFSQDNKIQAGVRCMLESIDLLCLNTSLDKEKFESTIRSLSDILIKQYMNKCWESSMKLKMSIQESQNIIESLRK